LPKKQDKLVITVTANASWIYPETKNHPESAEEIADAVYDSYKAGASIAHIHADGIQKETSKLIRDKCDILLQYGLSGQSLEMRRPLFEQHPDMISVILTHHDEQFTKEAFNVLHPKSELEDYSRLCLKYNVKPEFEVWHTGAYWNLRYLEGLNLLTKPYLLTIFFGWPGGSWSPVEPDEFYQRVKYMPEGCVYSTSVMDPEQTKILLLAIAGGGHVRVGTEDYPYLKEGDLARDNAELVSRIAGIAKDMGREIATPAEARRMIGLDKT
jgi:3-keto-5-aminohexanoate cleavage enzyme